MFQLEFSFNNFEVAHCPCINIYVQCTYILLQSHIEIQINRENTETTNTKIHQTNVFGKQKWCIVITMETFY